MAKILDFGDPRAVRRTVLCLEGFNHGVTTREGRASNFLRSCDLWYMADEVHVWVIRQQIGDKAGRAHDYLARNETNSMRCVGIHEMVAFAAAA